MTAVGKAGVSPSDALKRLRQVVLSRDFDGLLKALGELLPVAALPEYRQAVEFVCTNVPDYPASYAYRHNAMISRAKS